MPKLRGSYARRKRFTSGRDARKRVKEREADALVTEHVSYKVFSGCCVLTILLIPLLFPQYGEDLASQLAEGNSLLQALLKVAVSFHVIIFCFSFLFCYFEVLLKGRIIVCLSSG